MALLISASASLALSNCPSDQTKRYHNCFGTYNYSDGRKYVGEWANDSWHGRGTATFSDGQAYVGEWRFNDRHGEGTNTWDDGLKYVGEYKDDKRNGQGTYTFSDGTIQEGIWKNDTFQYARKNPNVVKPSPLKAAYIKLSKSQRKQVQSI